MHLAVYHNKKFSQTKNTSCLIYSDTGIHTLYYPCLSLIISQAQISIFNRM